MVSSGHIMLYFRRLPLLLSLLVVSLAICDCGRAVKHNVASIPPPGMVLIPAGDFTFGTNDLDADDDVRPATRPYLDAYYIDRTEVTNREYQKFDPKHAFLPGEENYPVTGVLFNEAAAYAKWAGKRIPTEEEWEKAARGVDGRRYPWGDKWILDRVAPRQKSDKSRIIDKKSADACRTGPSRARNVGTIAVGASPYGCLDMAGNAWEWVDGYYQGDQEKRILRGGAVGYGERACRVYNRAIEGSGAT